MKGEDGKFISNFYRVAAWRALGEICLKYCHKGDLVAVAGDLFYREYVDQNGVNRASMQVTATDVQFLTPKNQHSAGQTQAQAQTDDPGRMKIDTIASQLYDDEDLPF